MGLPRPLLWLLLPLLAAGLAAGIVLLRKERLADGYLADGHRLLQQGQRREALGDFTLAILLTPGREAGYVARARTYEALAMPAEALADLNAALRIAPRRVDLLVWRGHLLAGPLQNPRQAVRDFDEVLRLEPRHALAAFQRGLAYDQINNPHQAVKDYTRALALQPDLAEAWRERAQIYARFRDTPRQIADLTALLRLRPNDREALEQRGNALLAVRDFRGALADLDKVLAADPGAWLHFQRGTAHLNLGHFRAAIADFTQVVRRNRFQVAAYYNRARAYEALGERQRAHADWSTVCEMQAAAQTEACFKVQQLVQRSLQRRTSAF